ncbi:hypothetical protein A2875_00775 [Candidatus Gottesmanbacteria bacterium RIFCSPHIGHO2_01_FULL_46_14]|uniref:Damage-inducible protein J n=3 Tax=Microgenomates group TaxID=1794810 RepID=A0A1F5ZR75_9BACT|nr:MAG: hypothetical protein UU34_C0016G0012 [Candidatus Curtissbacteria bacterium GW2011_GWA1_41_11]OGG15006.1 MAG: hypothetical protein A2875_00775 [Candidatus Gottesmanbacteria bacterium RIFCSPHIGHO2_01_FULL_46_14]OGG30249.1 MAG: hypothetical protein A2971_04710 [Candidatus Gottesmanbacteria bacterium RIFCSPLOWO2_01_FULL_46_21]
MNTAVVNVKVDPKIKKQAQKVAEALGLSLSSVVNAYLRQLIKTRRVEFSDVRLEPTPYTKRMLRQSEKDIKAGYVSPVFENVEDSIAWLDDPDAKYQNGHPAR